LIFESLSKKPDLPPRHDPSGMTPLLEKEGKLIGIQYYTFLLLSKEEYP
jgi:hypothetical protein